MVCSFFFSYVVQALDTIYDKAASSWMVFYDFTWALFFGLELFLLVLSSFWALSFSASFHPLATIWLSSASETVGWPDFNWAVAGLDFLPYLCLDSFSLAILAFFSSSWACHVLALLFVFYLLRAAASLADAGLWEPTNEDLLYLSQTLFGCSGCGPAKDWACLRPFVNWGAFPWLILFFLPLRPGLIYGSWGLVTGIESQSGVAVLTGLWWVFFGQVKTSLGFFIPSDLAFPSKNECCILRAALFRMYTFGVNRFR